MSDSEDYEYEYDESDQEAMDAGSGGGDEDASFEYTDDEENQNNEEGEVALENAYYNAKGERDSGEIDEARETFESVVRMEVEQNKKEAGVATDDDDDDDAMDVEATTSKLLAPLKFHGPWSYKAVKQLVKLHLRSLNCDSAVKDYERLLRIASSPDAKISPNAVEKGVNNMLDRVASLINNSSGSSNSDASSQQEALAQSIYDLTLKAFHPTTGIAPNERLWFKTNLKYGQLLYEMNETAKLQLVIRDLLLSSGQPTDILEGTTTSSSSAMVTDSTSTGGTHVMEIAALQIQLYSRLKDTKKLRAAYHRAMSVRGGIPHPRTLALIQELGGKMHMSQRNFDEASQAFFQAFKSYDEAGDRSRLRCLKYLVMASMLHASSINPFDSHEARAHRDDPEIVAMTNLVQAFHNDDIKSFEKILNKNEGRIMDDEFVREHVADLLRTIRTQVIMRTIGPYTKIRLVKISKSLNGIPVEDVESLLVSLILDGKLTGRIDQVGGVLVKQAQGAADTGPASSDKNAGKQVDVGSVESRNTASIQRLVRALEHLTDAVANVGPKTSSFQQL
ncbi:COP9 signalosome complex subunit 2 [Skeletonema marinoi]|uniref:COP9 signalosome complex subunit 2 n=2 Tax=Skeletonema marinoi TaxID=267567 RepID=A0AAD8XYV4_9STRA|nr:COP9 signalosome complex subunit 2 [Skeletonema marinoi]